MDEELFRRLVEEVERDYQVGGLSGGLYEDYAHDILARYLAAQLGVQPTADLAGRESVAADPTPERQPAAADAQSQIQRRYSRDLPTPLSAGRRG